MQLVKAILNWLVLLSPLLILSIFAGWFLSDEPLSNFEKRLIILIMILAIIILLFGILRLYNAMLGNTRTNLSLKREISNMITDLRKFVNIVDREAKSSHQIVTSLTRLVDLLKDSFNKSK